MIWKTSFNKDNWRSFIFSIPSSLMRTTRNIIPLNHSWGGTLVGKDNPQNQRTVISTNNDDSIV